MSRIDVRKSDKETLKESLFADKTIEILSNANKSEIDGWVDINITTMDDVKSALKTILRMAVVFCNDNRK